MGLKETFNHSVWICWKDLLDFSRSKMGLIMVIIMPLFMMIMVGFIFPDSTVMMQDAPIAIANLDTGNMGANFTANLEAINSQSGMMILTPATGMDEIRS